MKLGKFAQAVVDRHVHPMTEQAMRSIVRALVRDGEVEQARGVCDVMTENTWMPPERFMFWMGFWDALSELLFFQSDQRHLRTLKKIERDERRLARTSKPADLPVSNRRIP